MGWHDWNNEACTFVKAEEMRLILAFMSLSVELLGFVNITIITTVLLLPQLERQGCDSLINSLVITNSSNNCNEDDSPGLHTVMKRYLQSACSVNLNSDLCQNGIPRQLVFNINHYYYVIKVMTRYVPYDLYQRVVKCVCFVFVKLRVVD